MRKAPYPRRPKQGKEPERITTMGGCLYYTAAARRLQGVKQWNTRNLLKTTIKMR